MTLASRPMELYKQKNGKTWAMRFSFQGARIDRSTGFASKRKAEAYAEAFKTKLRNGEVGLITKEKEEIPLFQKAVADFLVHIEKRLEQSTFRRYRLATIALLGFFKNKRLDKITAGDVNKFITKRSREYGRKRGVKPKKAKGKSKAETRQISAATINKELAVLKSIFNNLIHSKIIEGNPVVGVKFLKENSNSGRVINYEEERIYLRECGEDYRDFATILIETGMRPDELCSIKNSDVNLKEEYLFVQKGKTKSARRLVPLSSRALQIVKNRIENSKGKFLFAGGLLGRNSDSRILKFNNSHYGALRRSKIDGENRSGTAGTCTIYSFRHTFATRFIEAGGGLLTLAAILGHSSLRMVMRYAHPSDSHKFEEIKRMSAKTIHNIQVLDSK